MTDIDDGTSSPVVGDSTPVAAARALEPPVPVAPVDPTVPSVPLAPPPAAWAPPPVAWGPPVSAAGSPALGRTAMIIAIGVLVLSVVASILIGLFASVVYRSATSFSADPNVFAFLVQMFLGSGLGIWAFVQGIVAVAKKRGRAYGVAAIVVATCAPVVSLIVFTVVIVNYGHSVTV